MSFCLLSSLLSNTVNPLQRNFPVLHVRECQCQCPLPMPGGFRYVHTFEGKTWPQQLYSHLSWWGFTAFSRRMDTNSHLFAAQVWLCFGGAFLLKFPVLYFNFCHCSFSFHCHGRTFLSLQHLVTSEADNAVGGGGKRDSSLRSPRFAERGHYCLTFLLEFSIPAVLSSAACQSCLHFPSSPCHRCFCSLLFSS